MSSPVTVSDQVLPRPVRAFLDTEVAGTLLLLAGIALALLWANLPVAGETYQAVWQTPLGLHLGPFDFELTLREWVNEGLMVLFFFVIGMEVSREFVLGEMRDVRKAVVPVLAALGGMAVPALIYLSFTAGGPGAGGWAVPMVSDTALVLGLLTLLGPRCPEPLRTFLLTLAVVDDVGAIVVIAAAYTDRLNVVALLVALAMLAVVLLLRRLGVWQAPPYAVLGLVMWVAAVESGVHPTVVGVVLGVLVQIYRAPEAHVLRAGELANAFTRDPTPSRARSAAQGVMAAVAPNERLQLRLHPWTSYLVVPVFVLANAGIPLDGPALARALQSPVTLGIIAGLVAGKFAGVCLGSWAGLRSRYTGLPGNLVWGQLAGGAATSGIGFTIALFIAGLTFEPGALRTNASIGILFGSLLAAGLGATIFRLAWHRGAVCAPPDEPAPPVEQRPDTLAEPVTDEDHVLGDPDAPVTLVEYADYECPYCGQLHEMLTGLRKRYGDRLRLVFRNFPVTSVHPRAMPAAVAAEAAGGQGRFWQMHDRLFTHQRKLDHASLAQHAEHIGLDPGTVTGPSAQAYLDRIQADVDSAQRSGVRGTPTLFLNGRRYDGRLDRRSLAVVIDAAIDPADGG